MPSAWMCLLYTRHTDKHSTDKYWGHCEELGRAHRGLGPDERDMTEREGGQKAGKKVSKQGCGNPPGESCSNSDAKPVLMYTLGSPLTNINTLR